MPQTKHCMSGVRTGGWSPTRPFGILSGWHAGSMSASGTGQQTNFPCPQVVDPQKASYGVENAMYAVVQLAQTTMRSELGKITLDKTFEERQLLNHEIRCGAATGVLSHG